MKTIVSEDTALQLLKLAIDQGNTVAALGILHDIMKSANDYAGTLQNKLDIAVNCIEQYVLAYPTTMGEDVLVLLREE